VLLVLLQLMLQQSILEGDAPVVRLRSEGATTPATETMHVAFPTFIAMYTREVHPIVAV
jgi:hypothetical protein